MILYLMGFTFLAFGLFATYIFYKQGKQSSVYTKEVTGKIERIEDDEIIDGIHQGYIVYLLDLDHNPYEARSKEKVELDNPRLGKITSFLVNPNDPNDFIENRKGDGYYSGLLMKLPYFICSIFTVIGLVLLFHPLLATFFEKFGMFAFILIPIILGALFIGIGVLAREYILRQNMRCNVEVEGKVVDIIRKVEHDEDGNYVSYHPVVSYEYDGVLYRNESSFGQNPSPYTTGDIIKVYVNPTDGDDFMLEGNMKGYRIFYRIFIGVGTIVLLVGLFLFVGYSLFPK